MAARGDVDGSRDRDSLQMCLAPGDPANAAETQQPAEPGRFTIIYISITRSVLIGLPQNGGGGGGGGRATPGNLNFFQFLRHGDDKFPSPGFQFRVNILYNLYNFPPTGLVWIQNPVQNPLPSRRGSLGLPPPPPHPPFCGKPLINTTLPHCQ